MGYSLSADFVRRILSIRMRSSIIKVNTRKKLLLYVCVSNTQEIKSSYYSIGQTSVILYFLRVLFVREKTSLAMKCNSITVSNL